MSATEGVGAWTAEQQLAMCTEGANVLVAASAGTGKTAVLVERVLRRVLDPDRPIDVDRFLVVTFTEAAAAEMKGRILRALLLRSIGLPPPTEG